MIFSTFSSSVASYSPESIEIGLYGNFPLTDRAHIISQIQLDSSFNVVDGGIFENLDESFWTSDVIVLFLDSISSINLTIIQEYVGNGGSIVVFAGTNSTAYHLALEKLNFTDSSSTTSMITTKSVISPAVAVNPFLQEIEWNAAPDLKGFQNISSFRSSVTPLLQDYDTDNLLVIKGVYGSGTVVAFNLIYQKDYNWDFTLWWYSPYFFYRIISILGGIEPQNYVDWEFSPVPHISQKIGLISFLIVLVGAGIGLFIYAKRISRKPLNIYAPKKQIKPLLLLKKSVKIEKSNLQALNSSEHREISFQHDNMSPSSPSNPLKNQWEEIGIHRQINSFFLNLLTMLTINLPYLFLIVGIYYRYIVPFPMVQGAVSWVSGIFGSVFIILEMEVGTALQKFFAEYRIQSPNKAIYYAQIYVWWEIILAISQACMIIPISLYFIPQSYVAYMSFFFILSSITRIPGFFGVLGLVINGLQRFDITIKINAILGHIFNTIINFGVILLSRSYFRSLPQYGEAFGTGIGIFIGGYLASIFDFIIYIFIFRRLGYSFGSLFRMDFNRSHLKEALAFGFKLSVGNAWRGVAGTAETILISIFVLNYSAELGYTGVVGNLTTFLNTISVFYGSLMPAISEAHGNHKSKLTEYYLVEGIKWSNFFLFFVTALMWVMGERFLLLTGAQWVGSLKYIKIQLFFALFWPTAWYADTVFQGTSHAGYNTFVWILEQGIRVILLFIFLPRYQMMGMFYAYIPGIIVKDVVSLILIRRKISRFKPYFWHSVLVPAISAIGIYVILYLVTVWIPRENMILNGILLFAGFFFGFLLYGFFTGWLGGWDSHTLAEFKQGLSMGRSTNLFFGSLHAITAIGYRLSPLQKWSKIDLFLPATEEAQQLTLEKQRAQLL